MFTVIFLLVVALLLGIYFLSLKYWIRTIKVMDAKSTRYALMGWFLTPIPQFIFYFSYHSQLNVEDKSNFERYLLSISLVIICILSYILVANGIISL